MKNGVILLQPHTVLKESDYHEWVFIPGWRGTPLSVTRDRAGRKHPYGTHQFLVLICNNPDCKGQAGVSEDNLLYPAAEAFPPPPKKPRTDGEHDD